jgi:DNA-binding XRE family transcriptional regulator
MALRLGEIRKRAGIDQQSMADAVGVKKRTYGSWERGEVKMNIAQLVKCARILDCSTDEILGLPINQSFSDPHEAELHRVWQGLDRERQDRLLATAHDMETAKSNGGVSDWIEEVAE